MNRKKRSEGKVPNPPTHQCVNRKKRWQGKDITQAGTKPAPPRIPDDHANHHTTVPCRKMVKKSRIAKSQLYRQRIIALILFSTTLAGARMATSIYGSLKAFNYLETESAGAHQHCRRSLLKLWTKNDLAVRSTVLFPSCKKIIRAVLDDTGEQHQSLIAWKRWSIPQPHDDKSMLEIVTNCTQFRRMIDFQEEPMSQEEADYPLAYVFVPFRNLAQTVRLFRMLYHPQNAYCITFDTKCKEDYKQAIIALASCFPSNVFLNPNRKSIVYSTFSLVSTVMDCLDVLRKSPIKWRYVQTVSWNDFPLKTNLEMVRIFKMLNGSQDSELRREKNSRTDLAQYKHSGILYTAGHISKPVAPGGVTFFHGSYSTAMSKEFIDWMFTDPLSIRLYHYFNDTQFPDEFYWSTLIHNVHLNAPGSFPGECALFYKADEKPYVSRFQLWVWHQQRVKCHGFIERASCVFGAKDFGTLIKRKELIAHKIYEEYQPALLYCLEEWYWQKLCTDEEPNLDIDHYQNLPSVVYHNLSPNEKEKFVCKFKGRSKDGYFSGFWGSS